MSCTRWDEPGRCWCGDPREPGSQWCGACERRDAIDRRSQAREAAKHAESAARRRLVESATKLLAGQGPDATRTTESEALAATDTAMKLARNQSREA